jgi:hypothetical protein
MREGLKGMNSEPQSFIIKFWLEQTTEAQKKAPWHGQITHVPSGARHYLKTSDDLLTFMRPYLDAMGIKFTRERHFWRRREHE